MKCLEITVDISEHYRLHALANGSFRLYYLVGDAKVEHQIASFVLSRSETPGVPLDDIGGLIAQIIRADITEEKAIQTVIDLFK